MTDDPVTIRAVAGRRRGVAPQATALALLLTGAAPAWASVAQDRVHWELGAGLYLFSVPSYAGATHYQTYLLPYPYVVYRGPVLRTTRQGIEALLRENRLRFSLSASVAPPVTSSDAPLRAGMPNLSLTFGIGPRMDWQLLRTPRTEIDLRLALRSVSTLHLRHVGWTASPYLDVRWHNWHDSGVNLVLAVGPNFADRSYNDYYYGVSPRYATPARPAYQADGGYDGAAIHFGADRAVGRLRLGLFVQYQNLQGAAFVDSPLVRSRHYLAGGLHVAWIFAQSSDR